MVKAKARSRSYFGDGMQRMSTEGMVGLRRKIWLAGDRRAMTVLFERRGLPYVVPVKKSERISGRHAAG